MNILKLIISLTFFISSSLIAQTLSVSIGEADYDGVFDDTSLTIAGLKQIDENIAVEIAYNDLGSISASDGIDSASIDASTIDVTIIAFNPLSDKTNLFGKIGFARWEVDGRYNLPSFGYGSASGKINGTDLTFGAGLETKLENGISANIQFQRYDISLSGVSLDVDKLSVGLSFEL